MIVPVILDYNYILKDKTDGLWIFYKFLKFANENNSCIIGRETYFENPKLYEKTWALDQNVLDMYNYEKPTFKQLEKNKKYCIPNEIEVLMQKEQISWKELLLNRFEPLEKLIEQSLNRIESDKNNKIDIIITWYPFYSLKKICEKRKIKLLSLEFSTIRKESYNCTLATISENDKYNSIDIKEKFENFNFNNKLVFTREELIALFSYKKDVFNNIRLLKETPIYEIGYALGLKDDAYEYAFCNIHQDEIIRQLNEKFLPDSILYRKHPQNKREIIGNIDNSNSSREFISKCDKIIVLVSNVGYEAMLFGRKVSHLYKKFISAFAESYDINMLNDAVDNLYKLNFLTFAIYTPFDNLFDENYIKNLCNKNLEDIYNENVKKILKEHNLDYDLIKEINGVRRLEYILKEFHGFTDDEVNMILNINYSSNLLNQNILLKNEVKELSNKLKMKNKLIKQQKIELNLITSESNKINSELKKVYESKSWIYISKIRDLYNMIRRRK